MDLKYKRPEFQTQKGKLFHKKNEMLQSRTYEEIHNAWIEMKDSMYRFECFKVFVNIKYTCGIHMEIDRPEVELLNPEISMLDALQHECNQILLDSSFLSEF